MITNISDVWLGWDFAEGADQTRYVTAAGVVVTRYDPIPMIGNWTRAQHEAMWRYWPYRYERLSFEEIARRCIEMGLYICTCVGVAGCNGYSYQRPDGHRGLIVDPRCTVHRIVFDVPLW